MKTQNDIEVIEIGAKTEVVVTTARKRLVIGDIHGHLEPFKSIYEKEDPDDVIILGDYFDSFHGTDNDIIDCFKEILKMKKNHKKGEFILLIGNHDFHYMDLSESYSGKRKSYMFTVSNMLDRCLEKKQLQYVYVDNINKTVYSHAGIMNKWLNENRLFISKLEDLNDIDSRKFRFTFRGGDTGYGDGPYASPIWVRPGTLLNDMYEDLDGHMWTQIVGHTHGKAIIWTYNHDCFKGCHTYRSVSENNEYAVDPILYVIDSLPNYYIVEELNDEGVLITREIKSTEGIYDANKKRDEEIKKLAEACGILMATPMNT